MKMRMSEILTFIPIRALVILGIKRYIPFEQQRNAPRVNPSVQKTLESTQDAELGARYDSWAALPSLRIRLGQEECLAPLRGARTL